MERGGSGAPAGDQAGEAAEGGWRRGGGGRGRGENPDRAAVCARASPKQKYGTSWQPHCMPTSSSMGSQLIRSLSFTSLGFPHAVRHGSEYSCDCRSRSSQGLWSPPYVVRILSVTHRHTIEYACWHVWCHSCACRDACARALMQPP